MKYLKLFENTNNIYEVVFLPSGEVLKIDINLLWGNEHNINDYDIKWNNELKAYTSLDKYIDEIKSKL